METTMQILQVAAILSILYICLCAACLIAYIHFLCGEHVHIKSKILSVMYLTIIITTIIPTIWYGIFGHNLIFHLRFVDSYCLLGFKIAQIAHSFNKLCFDMCILTRVQYIHSLKMTFYKLFLSMATIITCLRLVSVLTTSKHSYNVNVIFSQKDSYSNTYEECHVVTQFGVTLWVDIIQSVTSFLVFSICVVKLIQFIKYNNKPVYEIKLVKHFLFLILLYLFSAVSGLVICMVFVVFNVQILLNPLVLCTELFCASFAVFTYYTKTNINNSNINNNNDLNISLILLDGDHDNNDKSDADEERKYPPFDVDAKYIESAISVYNTLKSLPYSEYLQKLIAEYAATHYMSCCECDSQYGFIECYPDYQEYNGSLVVCDANDDIRYYLNVEQWSWSESDVEATGIPRDLYNSGNDDEDNFMPILCIPCGEQWRCSICYLQTLKHTFDPLLVPGGCHLCRKNMCDDCSVYDQFVDAIICETCYEKQSIHEDADDDSNNNYDSQDDDNNDISKWNFSFG